jgi:hypothetical protein
MIPMARPKTNRKNLHYLTLRANRKQVITIPLRASLAKQSVQLNRTVADIKRGQEGLAITCANAECGLRMNGTAFPHPAYIIEFTDKRAYVVDKLNKAGTPTHCVVYEHNQGSFQKAFDTKTKSALMKMSKAEATFSLWPPKLGAPPGRGTNRRGSTTSGTPGAVRVRRAKAKSRKGAIARAERAGIMLRDVS